MKNIIILLAIGLSMAGCSTTKSSGGQNLVQLTGKIEKLGMSTFQYGTHTIEAAGKSYALKSSAVDLNGFTGKEVTLKGTKVAGYPIENGPELIEVTEVKPK